MHIRNVNIGGKSLQQLDFKTFVNGLGNDLKNSIDDLVDTIFTIHEDVEQLKLSILKPDRDTAKALLEYIAMEECEVKSNIGILCKNDLQKYFKWLDSYSREHSCPQEQVLNLIIEGKI